MGPPCAGIADVSQHQQLTMSAFGAITHALVHIGTIVQIGTLIHIGTIVHIGKSVHIRTLVNISILVHLEHLHVVFSQGSIISQLGAKDE